eukprot:scaffold2633_cov181-Alexandrium_tamarense.AAC.6
MEASRVVGSVLRGLDWGSIVEVIEGVGVGIVSFDEMSRSGGGILDGHDVYIVLVVLLSLACVDVMEARACFRFQHRLAGARWLRRRRTSRPRVFYE